MSVDVNKKMDDINNFLNNIYFPVLYRHHGLTEEDAKKIGQNMINKIHEKDYVEYLEELDTEDFNSLIDLATVGGIVYKGENGAEFEDINEVFRKKTLGTILLYCDENNISTREYDPEPMILPTVAEEKVSSFGSEEWKMFFYGDSLAFHNKYGKPENKEEISKKDALNQIKEQLLDSIESTPVVNKTNKLL